MKVELRNHPAQADHPTIPGRKAFDDQGNPIPLFPDQRGVYLDGVCVGYVGDPPFHRISFIHHEAGTNEWVRTQAKILVEAEFKIKPDVISVVPPPIIPADAASAFDPDGGEYEIGN